MDRTSPQTAEQLRIRLSASTLLPLLVAACLLLAMLLIAYVHNYTSDAMLKRQFYEQGVALTRSLSNSIWATLDRAGDNSPENILQRYDLEQLDKEIRHLIEGTPILKLKLFDVTGQMKYSSNRKDVIHGDGDDLKVQKKINLVAQEVVQKNRPVASYRFRDSFDSGEQFYTDRYIFSAYIPVQIPGTNRAGAVVEIYYDVSNIINEFNENRWISYVMLALTGLVLFGLISYLIIRNEKISHNKAAEREKYLKLLTTKNNELTDKTEELMRIKERTEKIAEERSNFMARMSHELRAPMNAVIGLTDLMLRTRLTDRQQGYINAIQSSGNILLDITDEILSIGRLETGYLQINKQLFLLREVIDNVIEVMANRASRQGVELVCDYSVDIEYFVSGDPIRLRQVLINLVANALKYTDEGYVRIKINSVKNETGLPYYLFEVIDSGIGISEEDQQKIFAAYCYLNTENKNQPHNTGLGLAISKRLVEAMHGVIGVQSQPGKGSCFWFKLPLEIEQDKEGTVIHDLQQDEQQHILLVSRNSETSQAISSALQVWGMQVDISRGLDDIAGCMEQSLLKLTPYSLIVIDYEVNGEAATDIARNIRSNMAFRQASLVFMIPVSDPGGCEQLRNIPDSLYINKPVVPGKLRELLFRLLNPAGTEQLVLANSGGQANSIVKRPYTSGNMILVVEDNPVNRELLLEMLRNLGLMARGVENGQAVLEMLMDEQFDMVLLDCRLPDMEGYEVAAKIRQMQLRSKQPVIIVTSSDCSLRNQQLCYESGVDDFLYKPIKLSNLSRKLSSWLPETVYVEQEVEEDLSCSVINLFSSPIIDKTVSDGLKQHDIANPNFYEKLMNLFISDCFERIRLMQQQLEVLDFNGVEKTVHTVKSGCIHIGAMRLAGYCDVLGNMARNQNHSEALYSLQQFIEEFDRLVLELEREKGLATSTEH